MLGGADTERLFLTDGPGVKATDLAGVDMADLIARHKARYHLVAFFCRPGMRVLDFPCGSGYATEILDGMGVEYQGRDADLKTIEYAREKYGMGFQLDDLEFPLVRDAAETFDIVACIEGIEHVEMQHQPGIIETFHRILKPGGKLIISSPINPTGISGPSEHNPHHPWELNRADFEALVLGYFTPLQVQILLTNETLSTGEQSEMIFAICEKGKEC